MMIQCIVKVKRFRQDGMIPLPEYMTIHSAGMDLYADLEHELLIEPGARALVPSGIAIELPDGFEAQVRPRSGLALKHGIALVNSPGTIDADYRGEIGIILINHGSEPYLVRKGERIAQIVFAPFARASLQVVSELGTTERGDGGFGHTGR